MLETRAMEKGRGNVKEWFFFHLEETVDHQYQNSGEQEGAEEIEIMSTLGCPECVEGETNDDNTSQDCSL